MSWLDRLSRARFGSFEFLTDSHDARYGRRLAIHEYPGADLPVVEDLGEKAREWKLTAYFIGEDYDLARDQFLVVLNTTGADWLNHPWLGRVWARARSWSVSESNDKGGYATVVVDFVHGGQTDSAPSVDLVDTASARIGELGDVAEADFSLEPMSADGMTAFVAAVQQRLEILRQAISLATLPLTWANQIRGLMAGVKSDLATLMAVPAAYAAAMRGLSNMMGAGADGSGLADTDRPRVVSRFTRAATTGGAVIVSGVAATDGAVRRNLVREDALRSRLLVVSAAQVALADFRAEGDRDAALASVVGAVDSLLPGLPDAVFQAAIATRAALIEALLAQDLKPGSFRDVAFPMPATVLAYRMGVAEDVLQARNSIRHPLFVQGRVNG